MKFSGAARRGHDIESDLMADEPDLAGQLLALLHALGIGPEAVESAGPSTMRSDDDIANAMASIIAWMKYLPEECVKTIVKGGWHWSI